MWLCTLLTSALGGGECNQVYSVVRSVMKKSSRYLLNCRLSESQSQGQREVLAIPGIELLFLGL
jgi:hypothetical protein